jgi:hypothetical protein
MQPDISVVTSFPYSYTNYFMWGKNGHSSTVDISFELWQQKVKNIIPFGSTFLPVSPSVYFSQLDKF